jgi:thiamine biosynthesis lipoprotein
MTKKTGLFFLLIFFIFTACSKKEYIKNEGFIFGTSYHIIYNNNKNLKQNILSELHQFNKSLNTYDTTSIISRINRNDTTVTVDSFFITCFNKAKEVSEVTNGAFDITVAPVVNAWGFGFDETENIDSNFIDSLMRFVGFYKVKLKGNKIYKLNKGIMLDVSAIAKGYGVDMVAELLKKKGIDNYMVEIGGEIRAKGKNPKGKPWQIGIDKPIDDVTASHRELQAIVELNNKSLATSGNYRRFYVKNGIKYSHTINPKTGYPARNNLLSSSVLADNCITADAFATAFMVLGVDKSIELANKLDYLDVYFIYSDSTGNYKTYASDGFKKILNK